MQSAVDVSTALETLSQEVSKDAALAAMRRNDPEMLTLVLSAQDHVLWRAFNVAIKHLVTDAAKAQLVVRWLLGQAMHPLTPEQSKTQAKGIASIANL
jgi:accessory colonization factor AcfC